MSGLAVPQAIKNLVDEYKGDYIKMAENSQDIGFCKDCGAEHSSVESDAENYDCDECGEPAVCGILTLVMEGYI